LVSTAITNNDGTYVFSSGSGFPNPSFKYGVNLINGADYELRICNLGTHPSVSGILITDVPIVHGEVNGQINSGTTLSNNDAFLISGIPTIKIKIGRPGENNHNYDFGFGITPLCPIPNCGTATSIKN
jgi:hypothetical protein